MKPAMTQKPAVSRAPDKAPLPLPFRERVGAGAPLVMGVLNATPDSFYAASRAEGLDAALRRGLALVEEGADLLDIGGESTRPGSDPVPADEEARRVLPVVEALARRVKVPISIDTRRAAVARSALSAGATWLNDVTALRGDPEMPEVATAYDRCVLMHMLGDSPKTMQTAPRYGDCVAEILAFLRERLEAFVRAGGDRRRALVDPGIGFGKNLSHNLEILRRLEEFGSLGASVVVGASRKSFLGPLLGSEAAPAAPEERLEGSLAVACRAAQARAAVVRVHDVAATRRVLAVFAAVARG